MTKIEECGGGPTLLHSSAGSFHWAVWGSFLDTEEVLLPSAWRAAGELQLNKLWSLFSKYRLSKRLTDSQDQRQKMRNAWHADLKTLNLAGGGLGHLPVFRDHDDVSTYIFSAAGWAADTSGPSGPPPWRRLTWRRSGRPATCGRIGCWGWATHSGPPAPPGWCTSGSCWLRELEVCWKWA